MNIILFDRPVNRAFLKPITLTRPISGIRCGIYTLAEKWEKRLGSYPSNLTEEYLAIKYPVKYKEDNVYINASYLPSNELISNIISVLPDEGIEHNGEIVAFRTSQHLQYGFNKPNHITLKKYDGHIARIAELPHLFLNNGKQIEADIELLEGDVGKITDPFTSVYKPENVFVGKNVSVKAAIINAEAGPVYIGDNAVIQEGAILIGPVAIGDNAMVAFGAKIRSNTTLGPFCRVGGEVGNSIFHAYTNKAHDGFLGNSYLGSWCNLGANTNNSNLKNNYKSVSLYSYFEKDLYDTEEIFCGTFMGDYTKAGISTMFNTGTVIGVSSNIFGAGFQEKFVPSFSWGGKAEGYETYKFNKALEVINATMQRRNIELDQTEVEILKYISENE